MKGYLNDKEVVSAIYVEEYKDGTMDGDVVGNPRDVLKLVLDALVATLLAIKIDNIPNEVMADLTRSYVLGAMDMTNKATKGGVFDDLC